MVFEADGQQTCRLRREWLDDNGFELAPPVERQFGRHATLTRMNEQRRTVAENGARLLDFRHLGSSRSERAKHVFIAEGRREPHVGSKFRINIIVIPSRDDEGRSRLFEAGDDW
jgi:hypothetical protein